MLGLKLVKGATVRYEISIHHAICVSKPRILYDTVTLFMTHHIFTRDEYIYIYTYIYICRYVIIVLYGNKVVWRN